MRLKIGLKENLGVLALILAIAAGMSLIGISEETPVVYFSQITGQPVSIETSQGTVKVKHGMSLPKQYETYWVK